jgi:hypothetical protein
LGLAVYVGTAWWRVTGKPVAPDSKERPWKSDFDL